MKKVVVIQVALGSIPFGNKEKNDFFIGNEKNLTPWFSWFIFFLLGVIFLKEENFLCPYWQENNTS